VIALFGVRHDQIVCPLHPLHLVVENPYSKNKKIKVQYFTLNFPKPFHQKSSIDHWPSKGQNPLA